MTPLNSRTVHLTHPELDAIEAAARARGETVAGYLRRIACESVDLPAPATRRASADPAVPGVARRRVAAPGIDLPALAVWLLDDPARVPALLALLDSTRAARIAEGRP